MFNNLNSTDSNNHKKSNLKFLIIISIILAILIIVCLIFVFKGITEKFSNLSNEKNLFDKNKYSEIQFFQPNEAQLVSSSLGGDNKLLLRYQIKGKTVLIIIDILSNEVINKIYLSKGKDWVFNQSIK